MPFRIIPEPVNHKIMEKKFELDKDTVLVADGCENAVNYLKNVVKSSTGFDIDRENGKKEIIVETGEFDEVGEEGYILQISEKNAKILAKTEKGIFYGIQSFLQLFPPEIYSKQKINLKWKTKCVNIKDYPRFSWRGFMLDLARHFFSKETVKKLIDAMAMLKMNRLHLHLTDDQGWRIEIKRYPKLTEIGSKRKGSQIWGYLSPVMDNIPVEGYYTKEDMKEIVRYASERQIQIVPEIDMPGHCKAAIAAYPELGCFNKKFEVPKRFGIHKDVLCPGKESTFEFLYGVLDEIMEIFPYEVIHIGGDEVPKSRWKRCKHCQRRIKEEKLKDEKELQVYFTKRIVEYLYEKKHKAMGWNEVLNGDTKRIIVQYWHGDERKVIEHIRNEGYTVMSKCWYVYLDYNYGATPLRKVYSYEPVPDKLEERYHCNILGLEAPLWTEWVRDTDRLYKAIFPRLIAVAEVGWIAKEKKDYKRFKIKLPDYLRRLEHIGVGYQNIKDTDPKNIKRLFMAIKTVFGAM